LLNVITSFSRITILVFIVVFAVIDLFQMFEYKLNEVVASVLATIQAVMLVLFLVNASIVLYMAKEDATVWFLFAGLIIFYIVFSIIINVFTNEEHFISKGLINNCFLFVAMGIVTLERLKISLAVKQFMSLIFALVIAVAVVILVKKIVMIERFVFYFAIIGILLLSLVAFMGQVENGAKLSLAIGSLRFQPSEFVKITFVLFISACIANYKDFRGLLIATLGTAIHVLLLVLSRDLGMALIFAVCYVFVVFIAYKNYIVLSVELGAAFIGGILAYNLFPHIQTRFLAWSDPLSVIDDKGYQISQSLFAIGTGGWLGSGLNKGMPNKIPVVTNDFIFAAISEEMGALVGVCLILCFCATVIMLFNMAFKCTNSYYMLVDCGTAIIFAVQAILNIGGVTKFIPSTGVTLPFISYGSNSLVSLTVSLMIVLTSNELYRERVHHRGRHAR